MPQHVSDTRIRFGRRNAPPSTSPQPPAALAIAVMLASAQAWFGVGCDGGDTPSPDANLPDGGPHDGPVPDAAVDAGPDECADFVVPARPGSGSCETPEADDPRTLVPCTTGSGWPGRWTIDTYGLPAYDFAIDQRCDPAGRAWSPRPYPLRDPVHLVGNGRGLVAMAHASGAIELYTQDRGHAWVNRLDLWRDTRDPDYPPQLAGGFSYLVDGYTVHSTRFEDLPLGSATELQSRRFGVGYYETVTTVGRYRVTRRTFAPAADARALVAEVRIDDLGGAGGTLGLVELWDPNLYQVTEELLTSDLAMRGTTDRIERRRRALAANFGHQLRWNPARGAVTLQMRPAEIPPEVADRLTPSKTDWFPPPLYLGVIDDGPPPDAVWLARDELFDGGAVGPPPRAAGPGSAAARERTLSGAGQPGLMALRVPVTVPPGGSAIRRFAFGYVAGSSSVDGPVDAALDELRRAGPDLARTTAEGWRDRLVWAAFPELPEAGAVQRELAWSTYNTLAHTTFDEYRGVRLLGQGGAYKYIHGLDGAMGDLCIFADAVALIEPSLARDTLVYALATQHGRASPTPYRYPYATTGVGQWSDVGIYHLRTDVYWLLPGTLGRYVALTRDRGLLDAQVPYWPADGGERGTPVAHVARGLDFVLETLGYGARGLVAMGTNDYADGVGSLAGERATPAGTSSTFNAGFVITGFPLAAEVLGERDAALGARMREIERGQREAYAREAWLGGWYARGFVDSGNVFAPDLLFLEPQVLAVLGGITDGERSLGLLDLIDTRLETPIGAMSTVEIDPADPAGGVDKPQIGGVWPVANAWTTEAFARVDAERGWSSFVRNTLFRHAEQYPGIWYGIWTGPDSYYGPDAERPGEADAHAATALTDYPALNVHVHTGPLRALVGLLGVEGRRDGLRIAPRIPSTRWSVELPRLGVAMAPSEVRGRYRPEADDRVVMQVAVPWNARARGATVEVDGEPTAAEIVDGPAGSGAHAEVRFGATVRRGRDTTWRVRPATP
jgi:hypothetical protein